MNAALVADLTAALSADRVRTGTTELGLYGRDASNFPGSAGVVCFPLTTAEVQAAVVAAVRHGVPFVARGSGTGLAGGATPLDHALVIALTKMDAVLSVDPVNRFAWVEPGVLNLDLTRQVTKYGLHFAPDPSSQQSCSIGGNVANTVIMRKLSLDQTGKLELPNVANADPGCSPGRAEACNFNRQDWAALLKLSTPASDKTR